MIPGYRTLAEFAYRWGFDPSTVGRHMTRGVCPYPRPGSAQRHPLYRTWASIIQRCTNPNHAAFVHYGHRGISVCASWRNSFEAFQRDIANLGDRPKGYSLDRIDNNKGYYLENVRWASQYTQTQNQRLSKNNTSGVTGISPCRSGWRVSLMRFGNLHQRQFKDYVQALIYLEEVLSDHPRRT